MSKLKQYMCVTHNDIIDGQMVDININGTSLVGYLECSYQQLTDAFGEPKEFGYDDYKCDAEWSLEFANGEVACIYNWKNGKNYLGEEGELTDKITNWNVGGVSSDVVELIEMHLNISEVSIA